MNHSLIRAAHLPIFLWVESINIANFLVNITPSHSNLGFTPYHILVINLTLTCYVSLVMFVKFTSIFKEKSWTINMW
jgi:hypothetical protein